VQSENLLMSRFRRLLRWAIGLCLVGVLLGAVIVGFFYYSISSRLPSIQSLRDVQLQEPMYVYASDGRLIGMFGETRRYPVAIAQVPRQVQQAFVAAEDANFYTHRGIDPKGISRALWQTLTKDGRVAGGSTITQQVARQFFLSSEYSYTRKLAEMLLAMRIEAMLSKDQILELYLNKSFFGNRAYGVAAAAEFYYGKPLQDLTLAEAASLVSSLKFPSSGNPISNPVRNHQRSLYVIERMRQDGYITQPRPMRPGPNRCTRRRTSGRSRCMRRTSPRWCDRKCSPDSAATSWKGLPRHHHDRSAAAAGRPTRRCARGWSCTTIAMAGAARRSTWICPPMPTLRPWPRS